MKRPVVSTDNAFVIWLRWVWYGSDVWTLPARGWAQETYNIHMYFMSCLNNEMAQTTEIHQSPPLLCGVSIIADDDLAICFSKALWGENLELYTSFILISDFVL